MSAQQLKRYRFSSDAQWDACLFMQADRAVRRASGGIRPFASYARSAIVYESRDTYAPVVTRTGEILWRDGRGAIHRLTTCNDAPMTLTAPHAIARTNRMISTRSGLWVIGDVSGSVELYEEESLTRLLVVDVPNAAVIDIASGGHDSVLALVKRDNAWQSVRINRLGQTVDITEFKGILDAKAFAFLRRAKTFVVLAEHPYPRLYWFSAEGGTAFFSRAVAAMHPCFEAHVLGSDSSDRVFLAGADGPEFDGHEYVLCFDADGNNLGELPLDAQDAPATGITAYSDCLLVTAPRGLLRFNALDSVPEDAGQVQCRLMTPRLFSPDREDHRRWLRIETTANLPDGSTLEILWAATDDTAISNRLHAVAADDSLPASQRIETLLSHPDLRHGRTVFHGDASKENRVARTLSAKLFDVKERYLWVCITLTAASGARLPHLTELVVLYPGRTLMEDLPAIYQRGEAQPDGFLRTLVGVLETTTQDIDARVASMGSRIHPKTAQEPWLNFIARWLGVPWDDGMNLAQKRAVIMRATDLAKDRGTRAGLEALLESLIPGKPRRFRVTDATADFGFAIIGGESCSGSTLPAILGGYTRWHVELDSTAVLGHVRLPCAEQVDDGVSQLTGKVRVEVAATAAERSAWEPWLLALITEMVPLTARAELRWVTSQSLRTNRLDGTMILESPPTPHLGTDAITGQARLPERGARLLAAGPIIGGRLH